MKNLLFLLLPLFILGNSFSQDKNAVGSVGPIKFSGYMFGDLFYNAEAINSVNKDINGYNFRRIYFTTDYTINDRFSSRFRLESAITNSQNIGVFVKDAYLQWKDIFKGQNLVVGISPTPAFEISESAWGYRSLEKTIMDYFGIAGSRDMGIDFKGNFDEEGIVKYWLKLGNNSGSKPEADKYKRYYGLLQFTPSPDFMFTIYGDYNSMPEKNDKNNSAVVAAGFINFSRGKAFSIGVEGFIRSQQNNYTPPSDTASIEAQTGFGISVWAKAAFSDDIGIVGRYDFFDPNSNKEAKKDQQSLIIAAIDFKVLPNISIMPGVEVHTLEGADNNDVTPRITFYWIF